MLNECHWTRDKVSLVQHVERGMVMCVHADVQHCETLWRTASAMCLCLQDCDRVRAVHVPLVITSAVALPSYCLLAMAQEVHAQLTLWS
jgi:hypothetical protein